MPAPGTFRLDFVVRRSGTVDVGAAMTTARALPRVKTPGLRVVQGHAFRVASARGPPDVQIKQSMLESSTKRRIHVDDLAGHLLGGEQPWVHVNMPAIATADERWALSDDRVFLRRKGQALAPDIDGRRQLYERMLDIGAYNFGAQYQQAPFKNMNDEEVRGGCFGGSDDEWGFPSMWFGTVSETSIMAHEVFGVGEHHPAAPPRRMTREEWERYARWTADYQRRRADDHDAPFGPPAGET